MTDSHGKYLNPYHEPQTPEERARVALNNLKTTVETDPTGRDASDSGAKLDSGKVRAALVLGGFSNALRAVSEVGTYGAEKYSPDGWKHVPDGHARYMDAAVRHLLDYLAGYRINNEDGGVEILSQVIWNFMAAYELENKTKKAP